MRVIQLLPELNEGGVERGTVELNREFVQQQHESIVISRGGILADTIEKDGGRHLHFDVCSKNPLTAPSPVPGLNRGSTSTLWLAVCGGRHRSHSPRPNAFSRL